MNINLRQLIGYKVKTIDGEYGQVSDCLFSSDDFTIRYLVIDPQKWNPLAENVLVSPVSIYYINIDAKEINLSIDLEKIKSSPQADQHLTVSRKYEAELYQHYGYGYYWMGTDIWGAGADPSLLKMPNEVALDSLKEDKDSSTDNEASEPLSLRSIKEVAKYTATASDDSSHHFSDFIFNSKTWMLDYAIIEISSGLLSSEKTVIRSEAIKDFSWHQQDVSLHLTGSQLKANPHFEQSLINSDTFIAMMMKSPIEAP